MSERPLHVEGSAVSHYLAHKQHLLPGSRTSDVVRVTRDIAALHATDATSPYLSLWARAPDFQRQALEDSLYERRELARVLCMRSTMHIVPTDELPYFFQAYAGRSEPSDRRLMPEWLLVQAGLCQEKEAAALLSKLQDRVLGLLSEKRAATAQQISRAIPELKAKIRHDVGKAYEGEFSVGSRLLPSMCAQGLLIRTRPRGTWRSSLYEYAVLGDWLPDVGLDAVTAEEAQAWLVRRYLAAFGPATLDDIQWWAGLSKSETRKALDALGGEVVEVSIEGWGDGCLILGDDAQRLRAFAPPDDPYVFFLPTLDPYVMGYRDRSRYLASEHGKKVFDRAGNAVPTVWANGRVVGVWGQHKDGSVIHGLFEPVGEAEQPLLAAEAERLEAFLDGEYLPPRFRTAFSRTLG